jgi:hypothetical protein
MMYYGLLGAGLFALMAPHYIGIFTAEEPVTEDPVCKIYGRVLFCLVVGVLLSAPYILSFHYEFLTTNARRIVQDYAWADDYRDSVAGMINNFVFPLRSDFHSAFGSAILFLPAIIIPLLRFVRIRIPTVIWAAWGLVLFLLLHSLGDRIPIHYLAWKYLPFASSFRVAGRILMIAPFFLMLIMVWLVSEVSGKVTIGKRLSAMPTLSVLSLIATLLIGVWVYLPVTITADIAAFSAHSVKRIPLWVENAITLAGVALLLWFTLKPFVKRFTFITAVCFCMLVCLQVTLLMQSGTWIQKAVETPSFEKMLSHKQAKLTYRNATGYGMASTDVLKQVKNAYLEPYLGKLYSRWEMVTSNDDAYDRMRAGRTPDTVIVETVEAKLPQNLYGKLLRGSVKLNFSSFNRLVFEVNSSQMCIFGLSYPFNNKWRVYVNDRVTVHYRANGANMAVVVPKGRSQVEFRYYSPATFWGMVIFFSTMTVLFIFLGGQRCQRPWHYLTLAIGVLICVDGFYLWNHSLYHGENIATEYSWEAMPAADPPNLAYSKESHMIAALYSHYPYLYSSGQAVDGKRDPGEGFITAKKKQPWWFVDLYHSERIGEILIYESERSGALEKYPINIRPLRIKFSTDGENWHEAGIINDSGHSRPLKIEFNPPQMARYLMLQASGNCYLAIDEIEVYTPKIEMIPTQSEAHMDYLQEEDPDV